MGKYKINTLVILSPIMMRREGTVIFIDIVIAGVCLCD